MTVVDRVTAGERALGLKTRHLDDSGRRVANHCARSLRAAGETDMLLVVLVEEKLEMSRRRSRWRVEVGEVRFQTRAGILRLMSIAKHFSFSVRRCIQEKLERLRRNGEILIAAA